MKNVIVIGCLFLVSCMPNYSNGERAGVITKLSEKGIFFKSWEGEMRVALPADVAGSTNPELFSFNVSDEAVGKVKDALANGKRVTVAYRAWLIKPPTIEHQHVVMDVK